MGAKLRRLRAELGVLYLLTAGYLAGGMGALGSAHAHQGRFAEGAFFGAQDRTGTVPKGCYTFNNTAANLASNGITLPQNKQGWRLIKVSLVGGAGGGSLAIQPTGTYKAHFPVTNGGYQSYDVDWVPGTTILPAGMFTNFGTAAARVALTFAPLETDLHLPPIESFCAIAVSIATGGAQATQTTLGTMNYDVAPAVPTGLLAMISTGNAQVFHTISNGFQQIIEAMLSTITYVQNAVEPVGYIEPNASYVGNYTCSASATLLVWVFYRPAIANLRSDLSS